MSGTGSHITAVKDMPDNFQVYSVTVKCRMYIKHKVFSFELDQKHCLIDKSQRKADDSNLVGEVEERGKMSIMDWSAAALIMISLRLAI